MSDAGEVFWDFSPENDILDDPKVPLEEGKAMNRVLAHGSLMREVSEKISEIADDDMLKGLFEEALGMDTSSLSEEVISLLIVLGYCVYCVRDEIGFRRS